MYNPKNREIGRYFTRKIEKYLKLAHIGTCYIYNNS